jgi:glycosyltransferase involved in cell wall biosynthesis
VCQKSKQPVVRLVVADSVRDMGGGERFVLDLARSLPARGYEVTVFAYTGSPLHRRCLEEGLAVRTARTRANGAPWTVLPLVAWLRAHRPDLILTEYDKDLRTLALAARLARIPARIVHSRECDGPIKQRPWIRWFHTRVADRILVASEATRRSSLAGSRWLDPGRIEVIGKGIELAPFESCPAIGDGTPRLGYLGQLVDRKRVDTLLDALAASGTEATLRIAGRGPAEPALRERVARLGLGDRVRFDGFVDDVPGWLGGIDALVLPSLAEGWGYVLAEAAAAGRLVVAYDSSSVSEVTPAAEGALLLDPTDPDALGRALAELCAMAPAERRERAERLKRHARARLGLDRMLDELDTFFRESLSPAP